MPFSARKTTVGVKKYSALVQYHDDKNNTAVVSASEIDGLKPPVFEKKKVYPIFWSDKPNETLESFRKHNKVVPQFPPHSPCLGPGFYPGNILMVDDDEKKLLEAIRLKRVSKPSLKSIEAASSASGSVSGDSGVQSTGSKRPLKSRNVASAKQPKLAMSDEEIGEIYDGTPPEGIEISDSESEASDPDDEAVMPVSEHNKKIAWWSKRYTDLKIKYEKLFDKYIAANDLNTQLTKSLMGSKQKEMRSSGTPLRDQVPSSEGTPNRSRQSRDVPFTPRNFVETSLRLADRSTSTPNTPMPSTSQEATPATPLNVLPLRAAVSAALSCGPQPPEEENEGGDVASEPVNTQEGNELVEAVGNGDNLAGQPQKFVPIEKGFDFVINAQYWTEGHPFRSYVLDPAKPHEHGIKGDKVFVNKGADHLWTVNELACSSVSGKACNANKAKNIPAVENNTLEPTKMDALEAALRWRVAKEIQRESGENWSQNVNLKAAFDIRVNRVKVVNAEIRQKINYIKKCLKRSEAAAQRKQGEQQVD